ncbi:MAG: hypothetical protein ACI8WY_001193 [Planctomycetota bacterium]|jgi:hypothetical protein
MSGTDRRRLGTLSLGALISANMIQRGEWSWGRRVFARRGARAAGRAWRANAEAAS